MAASFVDVVMPKPGEIVEEGNLYRFVCPHCLTTIIEVEKNQINCKIFRCGVVKATGKQIGPHTIKGECDRLREGGLIWGCARPFRFDGSTVKKCDYI